MNARSLILFWPLLLAAQAVFAAEEARYYDPVSGKMISAAERQAASARELFLNTRVAGIELGDLLVKEHDGVLWVELQDLFNLLDFPIQLTRQLTDNDTLPPQLNARGWYIQEDKTFKLTSDVDTSSEVTGYQIDLNKRQETLSADQIKLWEKRVFVPLERALNWFDIAHSADISTLTLTLRPQMPLPIQARKLRQSRQSSALVSQLDTRHPRDDVPYAAFSPIFADVQLNATQDTLSKRRYTASVLGAGDLAYMTGRYFFSHSYNEATELDTTNFRLALERNSIAPDLLGPLAATHVSLGDISTTPIVNIPSGSSDVGMRVSNRPYGRITNASTQTISGLQQPGWDVELYLNDIFIATQTIGDDGRYQFLDQALSVGENRFTLRFYGPQGQREEAEQIYHLDPSALAGDALIYDLSFSRQNWQLSDFFDEEQQDAEQQLRLNLHLEKGLGNQLTLTGDYTRYTFSDGVEHDFLQPGVRLFWADTLWHLNYLKDLDAGDALNFSASRGFGQGKAHRLNYSLNQQSNDFRLETNQAVNIKNSHVLSLQGPLFADKGRRWQYLLGTTQTQYYDDSSQENYRFNLGTRLGRFSLTHNLNYILQHPQQGDTAKTLTGNLQLRTGFDRFYIRSGVEYRLEPQQQTDSANLNLLWNIAPTLNTEWAYAYDFNTELLNQSYALNWGTRRFITSLKVNFVEDAVSGQLNFRFSLGHDPLNNALLMTSERLSNSGAVAALVFEDLNNNQLPDANEPRIENAEVIAVQQRRRAKTDPQGATLLTRLYGNQPTDIEVNPGSLADPFWIPSKEGISILPRPGLVKTLLIPIVSAGEIEGVVSYAPNLFNPSMEQGRVPLLLTPLQNGKPLTTESTFDGFYLFEKVPPGRYQLSVEPAFLSARNLQTRQPMTVEIGTDGTLLMGANFELYPADKYQYQPDPVSDRLYTVDLGSFVSENNAKTVSRSLRQVFPDLLRNAGARAPYELLLVKTEQQRYQLLLGPLTNLNHAKYLCGSLAKENLPCSIRKQALNATPATPTVTAVAAAKAPLAAAQEIPPAAPSLPGFTIQLMTLSDRAKANALRQQYGTENVRILTKMLNGQPAFTLISGQYPSKESAQNDANQWKARLGVQPWIRAL